MKVPREGREPDHFSSPSGTRACLDGLSDEVFGEVGSLKGEVR
jgi:hypothetical protein